VTTISKEYPMKHRYDLAISFAGEQRDLASYLARRLDASGYSVFFDEFRQAELWGNDLSITLSEVYSRESRFCLILLSNDYLVKPWTNHERQSAISQFISRRNDYILCLKIDDIDLPGLPTTVGHLSLHQVGLEDVYRLTLQKLGSPNHENQISHLCADDTTRARSVLEACFRRAIYTRMDSEINLDAMYDSIGNALGAVQAIAPLIQDQPLQFACVEIIQALDSIQRVRLHSDVKVSNHLPVELRTAIDLNKQKIVRLLLEIRRAACVPMQLPFSLQTDHFWGGDQANEPPSDDRF
jgi:hypothetical protein